MMTSFLSLIPLLRSRFIGRTVHLFVIIVLLIIIIIIIIITSVSETIRKPPLVKA